ncbi:mechanosensitive ion channel family protein, partial [Streptomyces sparsus]
MNHSHALLAIDFQEGLSEAWTSVATFVPRFISFLIILFIGWLIAKALAKAVGVILRKVGFERVIDRSGLDRFLENSSLNAIDVIAKLVYYAVLLIALQVSFSVFGPNPISDLLRGVVAWIPRAVVAIIIIVLVAAIANAVKSVISDTLGGLSYGRLLANIAAVFIIGLGVIAALNQIGVAVTVTTPVLITVLATIGGILVVGVGGGLIKPMQQRCERWLANAEQETGRVREHVSGRKAGSSSGGTPSGGNSPGGGTAPGG